MILEIFSIQWVHLSTLVGFLAFVAIFALFAVYAERKVAAFIQDRMGPTEVGPYGLLQTLADILKLLQKETIIPAASDWILFISAPVLIFASIFAGFSVIPLGPDVSGTNAQLSLMFAISFISVDVIGLLMAGWGANNKYALLGAVRAVSQIVAYEIPAGFAILSAVLMYGTLSVSEICMAQSVYSAEPLYFLGLWDVQAHGGFLSWGIFRYPHLFVAMIVYFIASLAECNRAPFDIPEAESELIAGFHIEYSSMAFAFMFLAEYANMFLLSVILSVLFLGGWNSPFPNIFPQNNLQTDFFSNLSQGNFAFLSSGTPGTWSAFFWGSFWLILKAFSLVFIQMWIRWTYPRFRADQLIRLCWKVLTPITIILCFISVLWKILEVI